jgi:hypothetical protein
MNIALFRRQEPILLQPSCTICHAVNASWLLRGEIDLTVGNIPRCTPILLMFFTMCHPRGDPLHLVWISCTENLSGYKFFILENEDRILVVKLAWSWDLLRYDAMHYGRNLQATGFSKSFITFIPNNTMQYPTHRDKILILEYTVSGCTVPDLQLYNP